MVITTMEAVCVDTNVVSSPNESVFAQNSKLAGDYNPGQWVVWDVANGYWILLDSGTAAHKLNGIIGIVCYRQWVDPATGARKTVADAYDVSALPDLFPKVLIRGSAWAYQVDPGAALPAGFAGMASATAGSIAKAATPGDSNILTPVTLARDAANGDTKGIWNVGGFISINNSNIH